MGATLSSRTEWTSARDKGGKLDFSKTNEAVLVEILKYVEALCREHPREATVLFKRPFVWNSSIPFTDFEKLGKIPNEEYILSNTLIVSAAKVEGGDAHFTVSKLRTGEVEVKALNFKQLSRVLECAGEKKLKEIQLCLEANQDPVATIMGPAFASVSGVPGKSNTLLEIHERLAREKAMGNEGGSTDELDSSFRLLLLLNHLDLEMLRSSVKQMGKEVRLSPAAVDTEMKLLVKLCGTKEESCLKELRYTSDMVFSNGCQAPLWRQVLGDICYIEVITRENSQFFVTASTEGYYVNKGFKENGDIDHERVGEVFTTLVALLKSKSEVFTTNIGKQEFLYVNGDTGPTGEIGVAEDVFHDALDTSFKSDRSPSHLKAGTTPLGRKDTDKSSFTLCSTPKKKLQSGGGDGGKRLTTPSSGEVPRSGSSEPSSKWKSLGMSDEAFHTAPMSPPKYLGPPNSSPRSMAKVEDKRAGPTDRKIKSGSSMKSRKSRFSHCSGVDGFDHDSETSSEASEDDEAQDRRPESNADLPSEYWQIQKLIKYLRGGNQTSTVIALCSILDFDLSQEASQLAIRDSGGMDLLINLLETDDVKCKIGTLRILKKISMNTQARIAIVDLGGVPMLVDILCSTNRGLKCLAAETIANVAKFRRARRIVRQHGGIKKLVSLMENPGCPGSPITGDQSDLEVARCAALGLWSCSRSRSNKMALLRTGAVPLLGKLLSSDSVDVLIPVVGTLQECASMRAYQELIQSEGMIGHLVRGLNEEDPELQKHCASAIFKCAEEEVTRNLVRVSGGLKPLTNLLKATDKKDLLCAATGAIWKCSKSQENVMEFKSLKAIEQLVSLVSNQPEEVLVNVVGALAECAAKDADIRVIIRKAGGVTPLVQLLTGTNQALLINTTKAVGACALETESMSVIDKQDGVRLLWSLLKSPNTEVQACAAWAICPCIQNAKDAGELVRSFVGGLELIVGLLKSSNAEVLAGVCAAIAKIAMDEENLGVITDHGVVNLLAKLTETADDRLRKNLSDAIARCCMWRNNRVGFGEANAVAPLVRYLSSFDPDVHRSTACALHQLSKNPDNCITMHEAGVVQPLLKMVGSTDDVLQEAAAGCVSNIRRLALANEKERYK